MHETPSDTAVRKKRVEWNMTTEDTCMGEKVPADSSSSSRGPCRAGLLLTWISGVDRRILRAVRSTMVQ